MPFPGSQSSNLVGLFYFLHLGSASKTDADDPAAPIAFNAARSDRAPAQSPLKIFRRTASGAAREMADLASACPAEPAGQLG